MSDFFSSRSRVLWTVLAGFFVANALVAEFMGVKLFSLEKTLGFAEANWTIMGQSNLNFTLSAGVLLWPGVFIMTDIINEYFGRRGVRLLTFMTAGLILYGFVMLFFAMRLEPAEFWRTAHIQEDWSPMKKAEMLHLVSDYNAAFSLVFGQSQWIIVGSLIAFLLGQLVDVSVFHRIKSRTGEGQIWMRATGSTLVSQLIDTFVVGIIALFWGLGIPFVQVIATCIMGYLYKGLVAVAFTPIIYLIHEAVERYLGRELADTMKKQAQH